MLINKGTGTKENQMYYENVQMGKLDIKNYITPIGYAWEI